MRLRTLLLGTTSLCLLGILPLSVTAQDTALTAAYEAYVTASSGDDADAKAAAEAAFQAECQRVGAPTLEECIALATGTVTAPTEEPAAEEPAPPAEEPASEEPAAEQPAPEAPAEEQPAPEEPAPAPEEPAPAPEQPAAEQPAPEAPAAEQPAPEQPPAEQPAAEQPPAEQPAAEQPAASPAEDPALIAAYEAYVAAASGDDANAKLTAEAAFLAECNRLGIASLDECLAVMGGAPAPAPTEPAPAEQPAEQPPAEQPAAPAEQPPPAEQPAEQPPAAEQPSAEVPALGEQPVEQPPVVETPDAPVAPVLDSQKDQGAQPAEQPPAGEAPAEQLAQPPAEQPAPLPAPTTDQEAQAAPPPSPEAVEAVVTEQGTAIETLPLEAPPNVEVVNQTQDDKYVINIGINITIYTPYKDRDRIGRDAREVYYEELSNGRVRQVVIREDGTQVITIWNRYGEILQRVKILPDGRRIIIVYYDDTDRDDWRDPGDDLPPFVLPIPVEEYVIYSEQTDEEQLADFLDEPPLEVAARVYSIDEVKRSARIRDTVRRVEIGDITFDTGEWTVERDQVGSLTTVAAAMKRLIDRNPSEVFLIEGHTDAVGSDESNLELSDRRAETIADLLVDIYGIPPENLTTQGYGEEYLKVLTEGPERANRRATVRRITPLVSSADNA